MKEWYQMSEAEALEKLQAGKEGLSSARGKAAP